MNRKIKRAYYSLIFETKTLSKRNTRTQTTCRNFVRILACLIVTTFALNGILRVVNQEAFILIEYVVKSCKTPIYPNGAAFWHRKFYGVSRELLEKHLPQEGTSLDIWFRSFIRRTAKQHHNFIWHLRSVCTGVGWDEKKLNDVSCRVTSKTEASVALRVLVNNWPSLKRLQNFMSSSVCRWSLERRNIKLWLWRIKWTVIKLICGFHSVGAQNRSIISTVIRNRLVALVSLRS